MRLSPIPKLPDFVGRFEKLAEDWKGAYTGELAEMAMKHYRRDIELFGYGEELERFVAEL